MTNVPSKFHNADPDIEAEVERGRQAGRRLDRLELRVGKIAAQTMRTYIARRLERTDAQIKALQERVEALENVNTTLKLCVDNVVLAGLSPHDEQIRLNERNKMLTMRMDAWADTIAELGLDEAAKP